MSSTVLFAFTDVWFWELVCSHAVHLYHNIHCKNSFGIIVYYKSLSDSNWRENDYNWVFFYSNEILCVGWGGNKI